MELKTGTEDHEEPFVSHNFVKSTIIGAILGGVAFLLIKIRRQKRSHTTPPIIIKSYEETTEPIEIDTENILAEADDLTAESHSFPNPKLYTLAGFGTTRYVKVLRFEGGGGPSEKEYQNGTGLIVQMWLENKDPHSNEWHIEPGGPHLTVDGTLPDSPLLCEQLSQNHGSGHGRHKRSFNRRKKWRIGRVQVDNNEPIEINVYRRMEISFDNHHK